MSTIGEGRPHRSVSAGISRDQMEAANAELKRHGVKCAHYEPVPGMKNHAQLVSTSEKSKVKALRLRGLFDKNAGYNGAAPENF